MSNYTKTTDFSAKDALASGDPEKLAVGADVDAEFDAIQVAIATKEDVADKGAANGYCPLGSGSKVALGYMSAEVMRTDLPQTNASGKGDAYVTLTDGATITPDCDDGNSFIVTLEGNRSFANATNPRDGQTIVINIVQDGTGSRTLTWGTAYLFPSGTPPTLTTTAGAVDVLTGKYNAAAAKWYMVTSGLDFS
jgi:hypothetical protein